jgi:hypothetical protein
MKEKSGSKRKHVKPAPVPSQKKKDKNKERERILDKALEDTYPASDPLNIIQPGHESPTGEN